MIDIVFAVGNKYDDDDDDECKKSKTVKVKLRQFI